MNNPVCQQPPPPTDDFAPASRMSVRDRLFARGCDFDFFQAIVLLQRLMPQRMPPGRDTMPDGELVRFRSSVSLEFPASAIQEIKRSPEENAHCDMVVNFLGLAGPSGVLPRHYTELLMRLQLDRKGPERHALADWLDLFNHRLIALFYRAWEKYRFWIAFARGDHERPETEPFTLALLSTIGQGMPSLQQRLRVSPVGTPPGAPLAEISDLALLNYSGLLAQRPRCAANLQALVHDYFQLPTAIRQFQGQWLLLDEHSQSRLGCHHAHSTLGEDLVVGQRVWDVQGKIRVCLGPLDYQQFAAFFPDREVSDQRKAFFLLSHLVRRFVGAELDFDVQLILKAEEVPEIQLRNDAQAGPRLGWNTWLRSEPFGNDAREAVMTGNEVRWLGEAS